MSTSMNDKTDSGIDRVFLFISRARSRIVRTSISFIAALLLVPIVGAKETEPTNVKPTAIPASYSPPARVNYPTRAYWGDTHVHTNLSNDAYTP